MWITDAYAQMVPASSMGSAGLESLLPLMFVMLPIAFGALWLAPKFGGRRWLWFVLFLIPIVNFFVWVVFSFRIAGTVLDRLQIIDAQLRALNPASTNPATPSKAS